MSRVGRAFSRASETYESAGFVQRLVAERLAARIGTLGLKPAPAVLELGAGTGFLTRALHKTLPGARLVVTDVSEAMTRVCRSKMPEGLEAAFAVMDAERLAVPPGGFDLVCSSLAAQWFSDLPAAVARLRGALAPGGFLALTTMAAGSLAEWRAACAAEGFPAALPHYPSIDALRAMLPGMLAEPEIFVLDAGGGLGFLRQLRALGAHTASGDYVSQSAGGLRRAIQRFDQGGGAVSFNIARLIARAGPARAGVFVTGTDTGVGKTVVAACLARRWGAAYWKPLQTGLAAEAGDTATVTRLALLPASRVHAPRYALAAPLSPEAAGQAEGVAIRLADFSLPPGKNPIVVEGAGGVLVPLGGGAVMADLMWSLGLNVILVARSGLGTINHTLLSLAALRTRGLVVAGVVLVGPVCGNRAPIEAHGGVAVLAELPRLDAVTPEAVAALAALLPATPPI